MASQFAQTATVFGDHTAFASVTSQQQHPGTLVAFHAGQDAAMQPFNTFDGVPVHNETENTQEHLATAVKRAGANDETLVGFYGANNAEQHRQYITPSMRAWQVPVQNAESRGGDK